MGRLAGPGGEEHHRAPGIGHRREGVAAGHLGPEVDAVSGPLQRQSGCEAGDVVRRGRHQHDVELELGGVALLGQVAAFVEDAVGDRVGAAHELVPPVVEAGVLGGVDALLPVSEPEGGVLTRQVVDIAVVGPDAEHPQVGVGRLEVGDGGVVVLLAELLDDGLEPVAVPVDAAGPGPFGGRRELGEQPGQLGDDRCGDRRHGVVAVADGDAERPDPPRSGGRLGDADRLRGDRGAAGGGQGETVVLGDPDGHRPEQDRGHPFPLEAPEHGLADGGQLLRRQAPGGQHHPGPGHRRLGRELDGVVGVADDEDVLVDELAGEAVDQDPLGQRGVDRRLPDGVADVGPVGHHAGPGQVGALGGDDLELVTGEVDRLDGLAEADVELVLPDQLGDRHRRRRLQDPHPAEPPGLGGDGHRQPTRVPADDHQVVGGVAPRTSRHRNSRSPSRTGRLREAGVAGPTPEG